jgi:hypothetical protein
MLLKNVIQDNKYYCCSTLLGLSNRIPYFGDGDIEEESLINIVDNRCSIVGRKIIIPIAFCPWCGQKQPLVKDKED